ncbi:hypothetical protein [Bacillus mycoides]|uniref:hypothetical protein n=1 Tax=Bacillus mycoides TaxID=1405 RepID=UPI00292FFCA5|nr:hypothetical protein [Bacillus mycoides]WOA60672.1 hypothetical protein RVY74_30550 [Bacillus mycoides]
MNLARQKKRRITKSNILFWSAAIGYMFLIGGMFYFWYEEGLYKTEDGLKIVQDYIKTIAQTNLSASLGIAALLVGVAALNYKSVTEVIPTKDEFLSTLRAMVLFVFSNLGLLTVSYIKGFVTNTLLHATVMVYIAFAFSYLLYNIIKLFEVSLSKVKFPG